MPPNPPSFDPAPRRFAALRRRLSDLVGESLLGRLFQQGATLFSGMLVAGVLDLVSMALTARGLGAEQFGLLAVIHATVMTIDRMVNVQSTQAVIHFGAADLEHGRREAFGSMIKKSVYVDVATSVVGALAAAVLLLILGISRGWDPLMILLSVIYSAQILVRLNGTSTAVLRLFDRYSRLAGQRTARAVVKLVGVGVAYFCGAGFVGYLAVWFLTEVFASLLLAYLGWRTLHQHDFHLRGNVPRGAPRGFWKYLWSTNLSAAVSSLGEADTLVVDVVLGTAAAGLYRVGRQFSGILVQATILLRTAVYPLLRRLWATGQVAEFRRLIVQAGLWAGGGATLLWFAFLLVGNYVIQLVIGPDYEGAYVVAAWHMFGAVIGMATFALQPAILSVGRAWTNLLLQILRFGVFLPVVYLLANSPLGLAGAGAAFAVQQVIWLGAVMLLKNPMLADATGQWQTPEVDGDMTAVARGSGVPQDQ